jgi:hypothetical protein
VSNVLETLASAPATLTVVIPPLISVQPQNQMVAAEARAALTVTATSVAPLTYQWYYQGTNLPGEISPTLAFPEVQPNRAGNYHVVVNNSAGSVTSAVATLTVVLPPEITAPPQNQVGAIGAKATFSVAARSVAPQTYQWRFNGTNLPGAKATNLVLNNIQPSNAGNYSVAVSNMAGSVPSPSALLTVTLPPLITTQPKGQTGIAGGTATLSLAARSAGPLGYQWCFKETPLPAGTSSTLTLSPLRPDQAGLYSAVVSNVAGSVTSAPVQLTVLIPPGLDRQPQKQTGAIGGTITFSVAAHGSPPLDYFWLFQGAHLPGATNPVLSLSRLTASQAGEYRVIITNLAGTTTSQPSRLVIPPPRPLWERIKNWF